MKARLFYSYLLVRTYASYLDLARHAEFISASPSNSRKILKWIRQAHHLFEPESQSRRPEFTEGQVQNDGELRKS